MSVEASLVMPLVLAVIVIVIYSSFCVYNRCVGWQDAYVLCMREAQHKDAKNTHSGERVENMQAAQFGTKYISVSTIGGSAEVQGNLISYKGSAVVGPGVSVIHLLLPHNWWLISFSGSSEVRDAAYQVRRTRRTITVLRQFAGEEAEE